MKWGEENMKTKLPQQEEKKNFTKNQQMTPEVSNKLLI